MAKKTFKIKVTSTQLMYALIILLSLYLLNKEGLLEGHAGETGEHSGHGNFGRADNPAKSDWMINRPTDEADKIYWDDAVHGTGGGGDESAGEGTGEGTGEGR